MAEGKWGNAGLISVTYTLPIRVRKYISTMTKSHWQTVHMPCAIPLKCTHLCTNTSKQSQINHNMFGLQSSEPLFGAIKSTFQGRVYEYNSLYRYWIKHVKNIMHNKETNHTLDILNGYSFIADNHCLITLPTLTLGKRLLRKIKVIFGTILNIQARRSYHKGLSMKST